MKPDNKTVRLSPEVKQELLAAMDAHFHTYLRARSLTPYIPKPVLPESGSQPSEECFLVTTSPLYQNYGYSCHIIYDSSQFDTDEKYEQYQDIGHWINQSFFIELRCILTTLIGDWKSVIGKIDNKDDKKYFDLLDQSRHLFAHSSYRLSYKANDSKRKKQNKKAIDLYNELFRHIVKTNTELNLSIDEFVIPFYLKLVELIKEYQ